MKTEGKKVDDTQREEEWKEFSERFNAPEE